MEDHIDDFDLDFGVRIEKKIRRMRNIITKKRLRENGKNKKTEDK